MKRKPINKPPRSSFDWASAYERIAALKAGLVTESEPPLEALEHIWMEHAQQLAKPLASEQTGNRVDLVFVKLGDEAYALEVDCIYEIRPAEQITPVPLVPDWVCGIYNLRGHILSVVDLSRFLGLPQPVGRSKMPPLSSLVVVKTSEMECAFLVDQVLTVDVQPEASIQIASELTRGLKPEYVRGIVETNGVDDDLTATLLNVRFILADERLIVNQEAV